MAYNTGLNPPQTWPNTIEQYSRPHPREDLRHYDVPTEQYKSKLYYAQPRLGIPTYRGLFRDHPHTLRRYHPSEAPEGMARGFHGRLYYEDGPPQFKYDGPVQDKLYWLERPPYVAAGKKVFTANGEIGRLRNESQPRADIWAFRQQVQYGRRLAGKVALSYNNGCDNIPSWESSAARPYPPQQTDYRASTKRITQDGVGYL